MQSSAALALPLAAHPSSPRGGLTLSWDLETLPLFSTSRAVKAYQMDLSSSARRSMAAGGGGGSAEPADPVPGAARAGGTRGGSAACSGHPPGPSSARRPSAQLAPAHQKAPSEFAFWGEKSPPWLKQKFPLWKGSVAPRRAEAQTEASSQATAVPCLQKPLPLGWPKLCKLLWDGQKSDPRYCREPAPGSGSQLDSRISKVSSSCVPPAPGAVEGLKAPLGAGHQPGSLSPARGRMEDVFTDTIP